MIEIARLRTHSAQIIHALAKKGLEAAPLIEQLLAYDEERRRLQKTIDDSRARINELSKAIGQAMRSGDSAQAEALRTESQSIKEALPTYEAQMREIEAKMEEILLRLPNPPHESVPEGRSAADNVVVHMGPLSPLSGEGRLPHWELAERRGWIDFARGAKVTGSGFPFYVGMGAKLQRALIQFFLDEAEKAGYLEMEPPFLVNTDTAFGTGQLPDKDAQMYYVPLDELYLIPTAEVPLTNYYRDEILEESQLPIKICGYSPCFRREAGSYGKDVRGLNRLHQFDKVEIVQITVPEQSYEALEEMRLYVQSLVEKLELAYRVVLLCGGDMSFASAKTYDVEAWSPAQQRWLEVSSISNFETFQSNRMKLRYRRGKSTALVHTLNGSALALPRIVAALLETHQLPDGRVRIPSALQPYLKAEII
ncbi:MAG: serine--tRNA ligase [Bacteroidia bacterium]|nr:serine--tRNA ligase [Bacteroidia bacterium]MCX7764201.1 serine--tRNA ligase [Bacteroidia bacterium]MDW8058399.1 serine--tRNA ligase [Bacteroidia bacterium]